MRALIQRVLSAAVTSSGEELGRIGRGYMVLLGVGGQDVPGDADWIADRLVDLRLFSDVDGKTNLALAEVGGAVLLVSQFTLYADARKGRRPSFTGAAVPDMAAPLYERVASRLRERGVHVETGRFGADMQVALVNDGPVTIWLERTAGRCPDAAGGTP